MAIKTVSPMIDGLITELNDLATKINQANINSCETAATLLGGVWPKNDRTSFASNISKIGKVLTETIEQNFSLPDDLKYQNSGLLFGSDILERSKEFKITNAAFKENMKNFVSQCVKYDITAQPEVLVHRT